MLRAAKRAGNPIRLAVLDHHMPEIDGEMLGQLIKSDPELSATSLVLATSFAQVGAARHFEGLGFTGYLVKPVQSTLLFEVLAMAWGYETGVIPRRGLITRHSIGEAQATARRDSDDGLAVDERIALGALAR